MMNNAHVVAGNDKDTCLPIIKIDDADDPDTPHLLLIYDSDSNGKDSEYDSNDDLFFEGNDNRHGEDNDISYPFKKSHPVYHITSKVKK